MLQLNIDLLIGFSEERANSELEALYSEIRSFQDMVKIKNAENATEIIQELSVSLQVLATELGQFFFLLFTKKKVSCK